MTYIRSNLRRSEWAKRLLHIAATATRWLLLPLYNILISKWLIDWKGEFFWGEFYGDFLYVMLFAHIAGYGNRDFLLREINLNPQKATHLWQECLWNRSLLLLPMILFFYWSKPNCESASIIIIWTISTFFLQSFDMWVVYQKKFNQNLVIELVGTSLLIICVYLKKEKITLMELYLFHIFAQFIKSVFFFFLFQKSLFSTLSLLHFRISYYFKGGKYFFLLALFGMLCSRSDIYVLKMLVSPKELARYQIISNLYLQTQAFAGLIVLSFAQEIYRFSQKQLLALCKKLFLGGIAVNAGATVFIYLLTHYYYRIIFSWDYYLLGILCSLPMYLYSPVIYSFYKRKKEKTILFSQILAVFIIVTIIWILTPFYGIRAAFVGNFVAQFGLALFYWKQEKYS